MFERGLITRQSVFDVDSWISSILPSVLCDKNYEYHCLCDYNLKVIEVKFHLKKYIANFLGVFRWVYFAKPLILLMQWFKFLPSYSKVFSCCGVNEQLEAIIARVDQVGIRT